MRETDFGALVRVMHKNTFTKDVALGAVALDATAVRVGQSVERDFDLRNELEHGQPMVGTIRLKISLHPIV